MTDKYEFKRRMDMFGDTQATLAVALGISASTLNAKITGWNGREFNQNEIATIRNRYNLTCDEVDAIFFCSKVS